MHLPRVTTMVVALALAAVPGLALAIGPDGGLPDAARDTAHERVAGLAQVQAPPVDAAEPDAALPAAQDGDGDEVDDEGHGEVISALAQCLPSGARLHGTGLTHGQVVSAVASGGEVELDGVVFAVTDPTDADAVCVAVEAAIAAVAEDGPVEGDNRGQGRPDHAGGPANGSGDALRPAGPPAHSNAGGNRGASGGS